MRTIEEKEILKNAIPRQKKSAIYFLIYKNEIVYVGQTKDVNYRINRHGIEGKRSFDKYYFVECESSDLSDLEAEYIVKLSPRYNRAIPVNSRWYSKETLKRRLNLNGASLNRKIKTENIKDTNGYYDINDFLRRK